MAEIMDCPPDNCSTVLVSRGNAPTPAKIIVVKMPVFHCSFCAFRTNRSIVLYKHVRGCHANNPNFMVYCHVCGASFTKWDTLRKYAQRVHSTENGEFIVYMHHYINIYIYM